ncbi:E3 ubiquitin-protein ligase COP1-like protein [Drosera capensis]
MAQSASGAVVPSVKAEPSETAPEGENEIDPAPMYGDQAASASGGGEAESQMEMEREILCPICMQVIKDAFLTACGHSFCYICIVSHLTEKSDCPCCGRFLARNQVYPNFALDKLLRQMSFRQSAKHSTPFEHLHQALRQDCDVSIKELDNLLTLLAEKKRKMERDEAEASMQILLAFLYYLRKKKLEELNEIKNDLQFIKEDIQVIERRRDLFSMKGRYAIRLKMVADDSAAATMTPSQDIGNSTRSVRSLQDHETSCSPYSKNDDARTAAFSHRPRGSTAFDSSEIHVAQSGMITAWKKRIHTQFNELQECYLQKRKHSTKCEQEGLIATAANTAAYQTGLDDFQSVLTNFTRYSRLRVIAELRHGDVFHSANIVSSIEFDRDEELFATAGVSKRIKVFEFNALVNDPTEVHCPAVEMATRSKLSCLSWNKYTKSYIASSDYEGIVTVWDVTTRQSVMECEEHEKRAWCVDFSNTEPSMLVSGGDDCKVKVWCIKQESSVINIGMRANICSVKFNPGSSFHIAVGSADHHIHYYDLRNISQPLLVFNGHRKAVSYVKFMSNNELASASTDSTLQLWDLQDHSLLRTYRGHTNEKNFVGLTVNGEYISCGSETNEVFVYHKAISRPAARHRFNSSQPDRMDEDNGYFISAVCWKNDSSTMMAASSQGSIKVLALAA